MVTTSQEKLYYKDKYSVFPKLLRAVKNTRLKIKNYNEEKGIINATTPASAFSWGENVEIKLIPQGENSLVRITSSHKVFTNILDGGASEENVNSVFNALDEEL